jgi:hypothetical protein
MRVALESGIFINLPFDINILLLEQHYNYDKLAFL